MTHAAIEMALLAPPAKETGWFHLSNTTIVIIVVVVVLGALVIFGWRSPDRSPHLEEKIDREEEE
jgi:heme/copper-type cytochrome/quinol oxidase subunit 2